MRRADRAWTPRRDSKPETSEAKRRGDGETYPWTRREIERKDADDERGDETALREPNRLGCDTTPHPNERTVWRTKKKVPSRDDGGRSLDRLRRPGARCHLESAHPVAAGLCCGLVHVISRAKGNVGSSETSSASRPAIDDRRWVRSRRFEATRSIETAGRRVGSDAR